MPRATVSGHRGDSVCIRLLGRRRLCGGVPVRCTVHQSGNRVARGGRRTLYGLWCLRQDLSAKSHRAPAERTENRRMVVMCVNRDKGAVANKVCKASCIGCGKCVKTCPFEAITINNNLAYIDPEKCKLCRKCEEACPKGAIHAINFPPRKPKVEKPAATAAPKPAEPAARPVSAPAAQPVTTVTSEEKKEA